MRPIIILIFKLVHDPFPLLDYIWLPLRNVNTIYYAFWSSILCNFNGVGFLQVVLIYPMKLPYFHVTNSSHTLVIFSWWSFNPQSINHYSFINIDPPLRCFTILIIMWYSWPSSSTFPYIFLSIRFSAYSWIVLL